MSKDCYEIITNYSCNYNCLFCSQEKNNFSPSFDEITKEIYFAKKHGFKRIGFSGGESTLVKDLPKIISFSKKAGFNFIRLQTNGFLLSDKEYVNQLVSLGLSYVKFTFLTTNPMINDKLTGVKKSFKKSLLGLRNIIDKKIGVGVNILINSYNYADIEDIVVYFMDFGVSDFVIIYPIYVEMMRENYLKLGVSLPDASKYIIKTLKTAKAYGVLDGFKVLNVPYCLLGDYAERSSDFYKFDTVVSEPGGRKWDIDENVKKNKVKGKICSGCIWFHKCYGVDKNYIDIFGWSGFKKKFNNLEKINMDVNKKIYYTSNEKCIIEILKDSDYLSTAQILKKAKKIPLCIGCKDGSNLVLSLNSLYSKKILSQKFTEGKYLWKLK
ncbi:MAG: radical SAM protein [Elusimicrobiales bacterium]|nr:radical SAM protein [Elusimicrobiales bacterium]